MKPNPLRGVNNLLDNALGICKSDIVLVACDPEKEELASAISEQLKERGVSYSIECVDYDGKQIPHKLAEKMLDDHHNVILLFFSKSIWHQKERRIAKHEKKKRVVSYAGTLQMLSDGPALANPRKIKKLCDDLKLHIENEKTILLEGPNGTRIKGRCSGIGFETGLYTKPGEGGNFPSGEIYALGLIDESVEGFVHSNIKVKYLGLSAPGNDAVFDVRQARIFPVKDKPADRFFSFIKDCPELFYVGELAFGICPYYKVFEFPGSIQEEKLLGTAHVGLGANISFGGNRKGKHMDIVFGPASVTIDDKQIIINGKINPQYLSDKSRAWMREMNYLAGEGG